MYYYYYGHDLIQDSFKTPKTTHMCYSATPILLREMCSETYSTSSHVTHVNRHQSRSSLRVQIIWSMRFLRLFVVCAVSHSHMRRLRAAAALVSKCDSTIIQINYSYQIIHTMFTTKNWLVSVSVAVRVFSPFHGCVGLESGTYGIDPFTRKMYTLLILPIAGYVCNLQAIICSSLSCVESEHNIQHQECSRLS